MNVPKSDRAAKVPALLKNRLISHFAYLDIQSYSCQTISLFTFYVSGAAFSIKMSL